MAKINTDIYRKDYSVARNLIDKSKLSSALYAEDDQLLSSFDKTLIKASDII